MCEMKNTLDGMNGRLDIAEGKMSRFRDTEIETIWNEIEKKESFKDKRALVSWDYVKQPNICVVGAPEGVTEEIMAEIWWKLLNLLI